MPSINPAVGSAIRLMRHNVETLKSTVLPSGTRAAIRRQAIACRDAMALAYEASEHDAAWSTLEGLVDLILFETSPQDLRVKELAE